MKKKLLGICLIAFTLIFLSVTVHAWNDDYPYPNEHYGRYWQPDDVDPWSFFYRECTSFVAWRLNNRNGISFTNWYGGQQWGDATTWGTVARNLGITVNNTPAVGAVAWWSSGHVAWVEAVSGSNVTIEEYNNDFTGHYNERTISASNPSGYIHIKDISTPVSNKTVIKTNKSAYNVGETVKFTFEYKYGTSVSLGIDRNGSRYATPDVTGTTSYSRSFSEPGTYTVYVSGWSQNGWEDSAKVTFTVDSGLSNSDTWIKADKTTCYVGDSVNFTFGYKYTTSVSLGIDRVYAERYANPEVTGKTSYSFKFNDVGVYSVYVSGWSYTGYEDSGQVIITVEERPTSITGSVEKYSNVYIAKASIVNLKQSAVYTAALYSSDGKLLDVQTTPVASGATSADVAFAKQDGAAYVKIFLWDSLQSMQPLTESERINL